VSEDYCPLKPGDPGEPATGQLANGAHALVTRGKNKQEVRAKITGMGSRTTSRKPEGNALKQVVLM
jgi:hypothetical protein